MNLHIKRILTVAIAVLAALLTLSSCDGDDQTKTAPPGPARHPYGLYAPGTIEELNPRTGDVVIDTLGLSGVSEYQDYTLDMVEKLGVSWVRMDFIYSQTGFFAPEGYLDKIEQAGIAIVGCIRSTREIEIEPAYTDGVRRIVTEHPEIREWQIENEPNVFDKYTPGSYTDVFMETREIIRSVCPDCRIVLAGAAVPYLEEKSDRAYFEEVIGMIAGQSGGTAAFDAIDLHIYGAAGDHAWLPVIVEQYREILSRHVSDPAQVSLWITETATYSGRPASPPGYLLQTEEQQASELLQRFAVLAGLGAERVSWSRFYENYQYARIDNGYYDNTGLIYNGLGPEAESGTPAGTPKAGFYAYVTLVEMTDGYTTVEQLAPGQYKYHFEDGREPIYLLWDEGAAVTDELAGGAMVSDYAGDVTRVESVSLGEMPVFARAGQP